MIKNIIFVIELLLFILALFIIALMYGITLSNLSYKNINISQLYIKYDKSFILKSKDFIITTKKTNKKYKFDVDFTLDMIDDKYYVGIRKLNYKNSKLILQSDLVLRQKDIDDILDLKINNLELKNFKLNFDKNIAPIQTKSTYLTYKNDNLYFKLNKPVLNGIKLDKSSVVLKHIKNDLVLNLDLYSNSIINNKLLNIISYYGLKLPIKQFYGNNDIHVNVNVPFTNSKVKVFVDVNVKDSKIIYDKKEVISKNLNVKYENNILKINSSNGQIHIINRDVYFDKLNLIYKNDIFDINVNQGKTQFIDNNVSYKDLKINIKNNIINVNTNAYTDNVNIDVNNTTNLLNNKSSGIAHINNINFNKIFSLKNKDITYNLFQKENDAFDFNISKLGLRYIYDGNLTHKISVRKFNYFTNKIKFISINDKYKSNISIFSKDNFKSSIVDLNNTSFNIIKEVFDEFNNSSKKSILLKSQVYITNSVLGFDGRYVYAKNANINFQNEKISIKLQDQDNISILFLEKKGEIITINAKKLSANFVNRILKKSKFRDGYISLEGVGDSRNLNGKITFHKTTLKDVRAVNNLITFINTTPAAYNILLTLPTLFRLGEVDFDLDGYFIKKGKMNFTYNIKKQVLKINSLNTKGLMADFKGSVNADFKSNRINAQLKVIFLKDYSKIIKNIPILGYIIVGSDGNFETNVDLNGTFEKQEFQTHVLGDTTQGILNIIKRTISLPLVPFVKKEQLEFK